MNKDEINKELSEECMEMRESTIVVPDWDRDFRTRDLQKMNLRLLGKLQEQNMNEITAWYDLEKRENILKDNIEMYYYMVHSTSAIERTHWIDAYLQHVIKTHTNVIFDELKEKNALKENIVIND